MISRPKINLRDLFWLTAVAATGIAWWLDYGKQLALRREAAIQILELRLKDQSAEILSDARRLPD
jgi:hypothetical protein